MLWLQRGGQSILMVSMMTRCGVFDAGSQMQTLFQNKKSLSHLIANWQVTINLSIQFWEVKWRDPFSKLCNYTTHKRAGQFQCRYFRIHIALEKASSNWIVIERGLNTLRYVSKFESAFFLVPPEFSSDPHYNQTSYDPGQSYYMLNVIVKPAKILLFLYTQVKQL